MIFFWVILLIIISISWALISLVREKNKKEIEVVKEEMQKGRVVFQSSESSELS